MFRFIASLFVLSLCVIPAYSESNSFSVFSSESKTTSVLNQDSKTLDAISFAKPGDNGKPCDHKGQGIPPFCAGNTSAVAPEPSSMALMGVTAVGMVLRYRQKKK